MRDEIKICPSKDKFSKSKIGIKNEQFQNFGPKYTIGNSKRDEHHQFHQHRTMENVQN